MKGELDSKVAIIDEEAVFVFLGLALKKKGGGGEEMSRNVFLSALFPNDISRTL